MSSLSTFKSKSTDHEITLTDYSSRPILRIAGALFILSGLYTLLFYLPYQGNIIRHEDIALIKLISFAGIISGLLTFYRKCITIKKDTPRLLITRHMIFRLTRKQLPLSVYDSLYLTSQVSDEFPRTLGEVKPSIYGLYIYQLYLRSPNNELLLVELQEPSAPSGDEPHRCLFAMDVLAREISAMTGKRMDYSEEIQDSLKRRHNKD